MKKKLSAILLAACAVLAVCAFAGCVEDDREQTSDGIKQGYSICYAFTASDEVLKLAETTTMKDYMDALAAEGKLVFDGYTGDYGYFVTSVFGISGVTVGSTANSYSGYDWAVYTTLTTVDGVIYSDDGSTFSYDGITLYKASYGVSSLPCAAGQTYALVYEYSSMTW